MDRLMRDLRHALRGLRRQPGFALLAITTLALGIGANSAIFSVVNGVLLRPLPYPDAHELSFVSSRFRQLGLEQFPISLVEFVALRDRSTSLESAGAYATGAVNLGTDPPIRATAAEVTPDLLPTLGVRPVLGRSFTAEDSTAGANPVAILSHEIWQRAYGRDAGLIGRRVVIDGVSTEIVGVMPPGYDIHEQRIELWQPTLLPNPFRDHDFYVIARRKDGVTAAQAAADLQHLSTIWTTFAPPGTHAPDAERHPLRIDPLHQDIVGGIARPLVVLQAVVALVLLIACANLANLLLARAESRQREFAVRTALGAGRGRLFAQFLAEGLVLSSIASLGGLALAAAALRGLVALSPDTIPRAAAITLDWRVLGVTLALALATGLVFALAPLVHLGSRLTISLRDGTRTSGGGARRAVRSGLVVAEVALAVTLVAGAGLLVRSFVNLLRVDPGFNRSHLVTFGVTPPVLGSPQTPDEVRARRQRFVDLFEQIRARLAALPGVESATAMSGLPPVRPPVANLTDIKWIPNDNNPNSPYPAQTVDYWQYVGQHFVDTLGVPVVRGRAFGPDDVAGEPVALINEALARRFFADRDPIGEQLKPGLGDAIPWFRIVGVLKDIKQAGVDAPAGTELYLLEDQLPQFTFITTTTNFVLRTTQAPGALAESIRRIVGELDPTLPIIGLRTMDEVFGVSVSRPAFVALLVSLFGALALALAAGGTYGLLSYLVTERSQEIGIRMALGANRGVILRQFLGRGIGLAGLGLLLGLAASFALTSFLRSLLFDVSPTDLGTLALVSGVMIVVAAAASIVPAWRASTVDPSVTLRG